MTIVGTRMGGRIEVAVGSITEFRGDAIVNAANSGLLGGGGVDGAIHAAAGPELRDECRRLREGPLRDGLPAGKAVATGAGRLPVKAVIHTVGPVWSGGGMNEDWLLASCYIESLALARSQGYRSIAFPAISTGAYGYPKDRAYRTAFDVVQVFLVDGGRPERVTFVFLVEADAEAFLRL